MSRQVWKFPLQLVDERQVVRMPAFAVVLHVGAQVRQERGPATYGQWEQVCLWVEVDPSRSPVDRWFTVEGTGHDVPDGAEHVGTAVTEGGALVWHVYEVRS